MKWDDITITIGKKVYKGRGARAYIEGQHEGLVSRKVDKLVVLIVKQKTVTNGLAVAEILYGLFGDSVAIAGVPRPQQPPPVQVRRAQPNVVRRDPPKLQMLLDVNRDGVIDVLPANNAQWTWGPLGAGAVIAVKTRTYQAASNVEERSEIQISWAADVAPLWEATIAIDHAARARIYRGRREDADLLLGGAQAGPLSLHGDPAIKGALDRREVVSLWIDAPSFPTTDTDADWLVQLTFDFKEGPRQSQQVAVLRITPWIMASDLQPNAAVYARGTIPGANPAAPIVARNALSDAIGVFAGGVFHRYDIPPQADKGFARDVIKSGFVQAPHYSGVAIQDFLDMASPLCGVMARDAAARVNAGSFRMPPALARNANTGQDNGGNLLVSPPSNDYPLGRIVYGTSANATFVNNSATFYNASGVQDPIILDSTWLRVGHVDEMMTFVKTGAGTYKVLLMSPRLAYLLIRAAASTAAVGMNALIQSAVAVNDLRIAAGVHQANTLPGAVAHFQPLQVAPNPSYRLAAVNAYVANPPVPANTDRWIVVRTDIGDLARAVGAHPREVRVVAPRFGDVFEIQAHGTVFEGLGLAMADKFQPYLDQARATLRAELGLLDADIIDVPVLLNDEGGNAVALTGDSVNMLISQGGGASSCLVPMPFGPVWGGAYVFEAYMTDIFNGLGLNFQFLCDDYLHVAEGEIHCGTNQVPQPLPGNAAKWWNQV